MKTDNPMRDVISQLKIGVSIMGHRQTEVGSVRRRAGGRQLLRRRTSQASISRAKAWRSKSLGSEELGGFPRLSKGSRGQLGPWPHIQQDCDPQHPGREAFEGWCRKPNLDNSQSKTHLFYNMATV